MGFTQDISDHLYDCDPTSHTSAFLSIPFHPGASSQRSPPDNKRLGLTARCSRKRAFKFSVHSQASLLHSNILMNTNRTLGNKSENERVLGNILNLTKKTHNENGFLVRLTCVNIYSMTTTIKLHTITAQRFQNRRPEIA